MKCSRCQQDAPSDAEFCPECGTKLVAVCAQCGTANASGHKFCKKCGQPLTSAVGARPAAAHSVGLAFQTVETREFKEVDSILAKVGRQRGGSLIVESSLFFMDHAHHITEIAAKHGLPAIFGIRVFMDAGGLMMYGPSLADLWRRAAIYLDKILKGAKPGDLPVEQPTKFELVINLKTARALGLTIPQSLLLRADQVIE